MITLSIWSLCSSYFQLCSVRCSSYILFLYLVNACSSDYSIRISNIPRPKREGDFVKMSQIDPPKASTSTNGTLSEPKTQCKKVKPSKKEDIAARELFQKQHMASRLGQLQFDLIPMALFNDKLAIGKCKQHWARDLG